MAGENKEKVFNMKKGQAQKNASERSAKRGTYDEKPGEKAERGNKKKKRKRTPHAPDSLFHQLMPIVMATLAALLGVCVYTQIEMGVVGNVVSGLLFGLLGCAAFLLPLCLLVCALRWHSRVVSGRLTRSLVVNLVFIFLISVLCYTWGTTEEQRSALGSFYALGQAKVGGGVLGGYLGYALAFLISSVGTSIVICMAIFALFLVEYGADTKRIIFTVSRNLSEKVAKRRELRRRIATAEAMRQAEKDRVEAEESRRGTVGEIFYDHTFAEGYGDTDGVARVPKGKQEPFGEGERPRLRQFFDADAEGSAAVSVKKPLPPPVRESTATDGARIGGRPVGREVTPFSEEPEIQIVASNPIPPNKRRPFREEPATTPVAPLMDWEEEETDNAPLVLVPDEVVTIPVEEKTVTESEPENGDNVVINDAHVVEHIGADTLASAEDVAEYANKTTFYSFPPLSLLHEDDVFNKVDSDIEIKAKKEKLEQTLENFGVSARIDVITRGPRLTRYELIPSPGVRISKIENLVDEITMNLEAFSVRIEAPIPGKAAIGVEVPNINTTTVRLRGLLDTDTFRDAPGKTTVCLGVDVVGVPVFADLDKMPHLLVAGATGMGKSVCINSILISLLYKARPDEVKLILIDPKKVEFQSYANIPHLLVPVVTEPQKAAGSLAWAVNEMERRYDLIESASVRNIVSYNKTVDDHPGRVKLPQIVIVIDELHDLMLQARDAVEDSIARIAAKARAAGILLIIGTQRPSVNVITGVIKANIPSRIAFHVASQVDSRTILDTVGAEKLLNNGDMLFLSPGMKMMTPKRVQGAFLDDDEVNRVTEYLRKNSSAVEYDQSVMADMERESEKYNKDKKQGNDFGGSESSADMGEDELFYKAVEVALESGKISTSLLQRRLSLGFGKAARLIDRMCDMGIVSPPNGQKPRDVLISMEEYRAMRLRNDE